MISTAMRRSSLPVALAAITASGMGFGTFVHSDEGAFSPKEWREFPLASSTTLNHNTKRLKVKLPTPESKMGMTVASCLLIKGRDPADTKDVIRPYTPTTTNDIKGYFELVIKDYPNGNVSSYLHKLKVGDKVAVKGPFPKLAYKANMHKKIGMIAGGSGITPMLQILQEALSNPEDKTEFTLIFCNQTPDDIMLKDELDELAAKHKQFKVIYKVDRPTDSWKGGVGYITDGDIETLFPTPEEDHMILVCGPPPMMKSISGDKAADKSQGELEGLLKKMGYFGMFVYKF